MKGPVMTRIPILIVSGFLGAGKTTCIQQLLREFPTTERVMVIENDFGSVSYDADVLASQGAQLKALPSGCICCSLAGNFLQALYSVLTKTDVDFIIIEPSGVAKVSDILRICDHPDIADKVLVVGVWTIVDGQKGLFYVKNFGEFFADQIHYADTILLNRLDPKPDWYDETIDTLRQENGHARLVTKPLEHISLRQLLIGTPDSSAHSVPIPLESHHDHEHHHHGDEVFTAVTLEAADILTAAKWQAKVERLLLPKTGTILRIKGIMPSLKGYISIQYSGGDVVVELTDTKGHILTVIGAHIDSEEIHQLWN